jgi:hypothetical protein
VFTPKSDEAVLDQAGHKDISELTGAVRDLAKALKPLEALAEHVPTLVEMASVWNAGKSGGRAAWRAGDLTGAVAKWITAIGGAIVFVWLMLHARWDLIVKAVQP